MDREKPPRAPGNPRGLSGSWVGVGSQRHAPADSGGAMDALTSIDSEPCRAAAVETRQKVVDREQGVNEGACDGRLPSDG